MYILRRPAAQLRDFIEHYWFVLDVAGEGVDLRVEVFVDARADLIFNFGAPYRREVIGGPAAEIAASNFDAQRLVPIRIEQHGRVRVSGVRFHLGGVGPFTTSTPRRVERIDAAARGAVRRRRRATSRSSFATSEIRMPRRHSSMRSSSSGSRASVRIAPSCSPSTRSAPAAARLGTAELTEVADVSRRHLERLFARELGFPPKTVGRVMRFQRALKSLMSTPDESLSALASATGYFDQAHFIRDFKQFTGGIPRGYRGYYPPAGPTDFAPNVVVFVQDGRGYPDPD